MKAELMKLIDELRHGLSFEVQEKAAQELYRLSERLDELAFAPDRLRGERDHALRQLNGFERRSRELAHEVASLTETLGGLAHELKAEQSKDATLKSDLKAARKAAAWLHKCIRWDRDRMKTIQEANERWPFLSEEKAPNDETATVPV